MCERETAGKTGDSSGLYACVRVCKSVRNVRTHVCVASRARMRRERWIVVIAYFIMSESEADNQARGRTVGWSVQACSRIKQVSSPRCQLVNTNPMKTTIVSSRCAPCGRTYHTYRMLHASDFIICETKTYDRMKLMWMRERRTRTLMYVWCMTLGYEITCHGCLLAQIYFDMKRIYITRLCLCFFPYLYASPPPRISPVSSSQIEFFTTHLSLWCIKLLFHDW